MIYSFCAPSYRAGRIKKGGYDAIILSGTEVAGASDEEFVSIKKTLNMLELPCNALNVFCPADIKFTGPDRDMQKLGDYCGVLMPRAAELGVRYIGVGGPKSRSIPEGYPASDADRDMIETLGVISDAAAREGITVLLEAVCALECNYITTTAEAQRIVEAANIKNLRLVFDSFHAYEMNEDTSGLEAAMPLIELVHVAHDAGHVRRPPQDGFAMEQQKYMDALVKGGYDGEISVEAAAGFTDNEVRMALPIMKQMVEKALGK